MSLHEVYRKLAENRQLSQEIAKAKEQFAFKPFAVEYRPVYLAALYGRWLFSAFSVVTGFTALAMPFASALPVWVAYGLAGLLLILIEGGKGFFTAVSLRAFFGCGRVSVLAVPALACFGLSVWLSLSGVQSLYTGLDTSKADLSAQWDARADSLADHYGKLIEAEKQALAEFKSSISWKGKIDTYNPTNRAVIEAHTQRIAQLETDRRDALHAVENDRAGTLAELDKQTGFNIGFWVVVSGANELLILLSVWFVVFYAYRIALDSEVFTLPDQRFGLGLSDLQRFADLVRLNSPQLPALPIGEDKPQIGFKKPVDTPNDKGINMAQTNPINTPVATLQNSGVNTGLNTGINTPAPMDAEHEKKRAEMKAFLAKYAHVVADINTGLSISQCEQKHSLSRSTIQNIRRCMAAVG